MQIVTSIENNYRKLQKEKGMVMPKNAQTSGGKQTTTGIPTLHTHASHATLPSCRM